MVQTFLPLEPLAAARELGSYIGNSHLKRRTVSLFESIRNSFLSESNDESGEMAEKLLHSGFELKELDLMKLGMCLTHQATICSIR